MHENGKKLTVMEYPDEIILLHKLQLLLESPNPYVIPKTKKFYQMAWVIFVIFSL